MLANLSFAWHWPEAAYGVAAILAVIGIVWAFLDFAWKRAIK